MRLYNEVMWRGFRDELAKLATYVSGGTFTPQHVTDALAKLKATSAAKRLATTSAPMNLTGSLQKMRHEARQLGASVGPTR